ADAGVAAARRAVELDRLNPMVHRHLGYTLVDARRFQEAIAAHQEAMALDPDSATDRAFVGLAYYVLGDFPRAQSLSEVPSEQIQWLKECVALTYDKLGRRADAEAVLGRYRAEMGDAAAYQYAEIYAQWGNPAKALEWLDTAMRLKDPGLAGL